MSSFTIASLGSFLLLASSALGHMALDSPPPLRAKNNPNYANGGLVDFDLTSPLSPSGSNFPCKGYLPDIFGASPVSKPVATLTAGSAFNVSFAGSATHAGGSCQLSLSYDQGATWGVIHEIIGGCPLQANVGFTVPSGVPGGEAVLSWTWFNKVGNREMYQNCAHVTVTGSGTSLTVPRMLEANIKGGPCSTVEGDDVDFANPNLTDCPNPITTADKVTLTSGGGGGGAPTSSSPEQEPTPSEPVETSTSTSASETASDEPTPTSTEAPEPSETDDCPPEDDDEDDESDDDEPTSSVPASSSSAPVPAPTSTSPPATESPPASGSCTNGAILCGADGTTWSMCSNGVEIDMGSVAAGMTCVDGKHIAKLSGRRMGRHWGAMKRLESSH